MRIVVLDGFTENPGDLSWGPFEKFGEVVVYDRTSYVEAPLIAERLQGADIAVINKTPISKETIDKCPDLKAIAVLATGYNVVDYTYAKEKGIAVMNVPTYGTQIVGQYAVGLLLEICAHYVLINNSRGQLVVEQDLADALNSGKVYAAGLDVVSTEPIRGDNPLLKARNCFITPHISWAAQAARQRIMDITADNIKAFIEGKPVNVVNIVV